MGRALFRLSRAPLCRTLRESGGHDKLGSACPYGSDGHAIGVRRTRCRMASLEATCRRLMASSSGQWRLLRFGHARLPPVLQLLSGLGFEPLRDRMLVLVYRSVIAEFRVQPCRSRRADADDLQNHFLILGAIEMMQ